MYQSIVDCVAAFLANDSRWQLVVDVKLDIDSVIPSHKHIFRLRLTWDSGFSSTLLVKKVQRSEYESQQFVASAFERSVPAVYGSIPISDHDSNESVYMLMEDLTSSGMISIQQIKRISHREAKAGKADKHLQVYWRAIEVLAAIHTHFAGKQADLMQRNIYPHSTVSSQEVSLIQSTPDLLALFAQLFGLPLDNKTIEEVRNISTHFDSYINLFNAPDALTLIHGDFHLDNILCNQDEEIRLIDWGEAAIHIPQWDLVLFGEYEVSRYLDAAQSYSVHPFCVHTFYKQLKAAVIIRMYYLIHTSISMILSPTSSFTSKSALTLLPVYAKRIVEAANTSSFRGGNLARHFCSQD